MIHMIVIDDVCRFALHVLRYLGAPLGFGIGKVPYDDSEKNRFRKKNDDPKPILTEDGSVALWWLPAEGATWKPKLEKLFKNIQDSPKWILIDMKGRKKNGTNYHPKEVLKFLKEHGPTKADEKEGLHVHLVSSYNSGTLAWGEKEIEILPKSPETLWSIAHEVRGTTHSECGGVTTSSDSDRNVAHILVTGAGFEIRESYQERFGLPSTALVLAEMGFPFGEGDYTLSPNPNCFPYPNDGIYAETTWRHAKIKEISEKGDLDAYWDFILEIALSERLERQVGLERMRKKSSAAFHEIALREAFRRSLLKYDWGFINHNIHAARLDWFCWLTTNYTRFADRSIELVQTLKDENGALPKKIEDDSPIGPIILSKEEREYPAWKIIGTANEARVLLRENLHGSLDPNRCLFKLHGDIGHLHTMAMAGQDKETYSTLSTPIDSLHLIYSSAEQHLIRKLKRGAGHVVWHIIGHSLKDILLRRLISNVTRLDDNIKTTYIIVDLKLSEQIRELATSLGKSPTKRPVTIKGIETTAAQYIAHIFRQCLPRESKLNSWLGSLEKHFEGLKHLNCGTAAVTKK